MAGLWVDYLLDEDCYMLADFAWSIASNANPYGKAKTTGSAPSKAAKKLNKVIKTPTPTTKPSPYGPTIAGKVPDGVPKNWSKSDIEDAIADYKTSLNSRIKEFEDFDLTGKSTKK